MAARYARAAEGGGEKRARGQSSGVGAGHDVDAGNARRIRGAGDRVGTNLPAFDGRADASRGDEIGAARLEGFVEREEFVLLVVLLEEADAGDTVRVDATSLLVDQPLDVGDHHLELDTGPRERSDPVHWKHHVDRTESDRLRPDVATECEQGSKFSERVDLGADHLMRVVPDLFLRGGGGSGEPEGGGGEAERDGPGDGHGGLRGD